MKHFNLKYLIKDQVNQIKSIYEREIYDLLFADG